MSSGKNRGLSASILCSYFSNLSLNHRKIRSGYHDGYGRANRHAHHPLRDRGNRDDAHRLPGGESPYLSESFRSCRRLSREKGA